MELLIIEAEVWKMLGGRHRGAVLAACEQIGFLRRKWDVANHTKYVISAVGDALAIFGMEPRRPQDPSTHHIQVNKVARTQVVKNGREQR